MIITPVWNFGLINDVDREVVVRVSDLDIFSGVRNSAIASPVNLAFFSVLKPDYSTFIRGNRVMIFSQSEAVYRFLPKSVIEFLQDYNNKGVVKSAFKPFYFVINLPLRVLNVRTLERLDRKV